jgi:hypothetical protein
MSSIADHYCDTFIEPAIKERYAAETISLPRLKDIYPVLTKQEIQSGWTLLYIPAYKLKKPVYWEYDEECKCYLKQEFIHDAFGNIKDKYLLSYKRLLQHVKWCDKPPKKRTPRWLLAPFQTCSFLRIDIDCHRIGDKQKFFEKAAKLQTILPEHLTTTSPGDIHHGEHVQGAYAWVKWPSPYTTHQTKPVLDAFFKHHQLEVEYNCAVTQIRLPGQKYVDLCDIKDGHIVTLPFASQMESLENFQKAWAELKPVSLEFFKIGESNDISKTDATRTTAKGTGLQEDAQEQETDPLSTHFHSIQQPTLNEGGTAHTGGGQGRANGAADKRLRGASARECGPVPVCHDTAEKREPRHSNNDANAFWRETRIVKRIKREHPHLSVQQLADASRTEFIAVSNKGGWTDHTSNPPRMAKLIWRCALHTDRTYDPRKHIPKERLEKDKQDAERYAPVKAIKPQHLAEALRWTGIDKSKLRAFFSASHQYNGRVAAKKCYRFNSDGIFDNVKEFRKMSSCLVIASDFSQEKKVCRQYMPSEMLIKKAQWIQDNQWKPSYNPNASIDKITAQAINDKQQSDENSETVYVEPHSMSPCTSPTATSFILPVGHMKDDFWVLT